MKWFCMLFFFSTVTVAQSEPRCVREDGGKTKKESEVLERGFFGTEGGEGFLWYCDITEIEKKEEKEEEPAPPPPPKEPEEPKKDAPPPLSVVWIQENLPKVRDKAIDSPTYKNVQAFYYLHRYMMDKAHLFADVAEEVTNTDPFLDEEFASLTKVSKQESKVQSYSSVFKIFKQVEGLELAYFYRSDCVYCIQNYVVGQAMNSKYGVKVNYLSIDGKPLNKEIKYQDGLDEAITLGISKTPSIAVRAKGVDGGYQLISEGAKSLGEIEENVRYWIRKNKLVDDELWDSSKYIKRPSYSEESPEELDISDPESLVDQIRDLYEKD